MGRRPGPGRTKSRKNVARLGVVRSRNAFLPFDAFTSALLWDEPFPALTTPALGRDAQEIVEAGLASMRTGQRVGLPLASFLA